MNEPDFRTLRTEFSRVAGRFGLARTLEREWDFYLDEPRWPWWRSELGSIAWLSGRNAVLDRPTSNGGRGFDEEFAEMAALFETLERYALAAAQPTHQSRAGDPPAGAVSLDRFDTRGVGAGRNPVLGWFRADELRTNRTAWIPEQIVRVPYRERAGEVLVRDPITTGTAAGLTTDAASLRGALELVERHTIMSAYFGVGAPRLVDGRRVGTGVSALVEDCARYGLIITLYRIDSPIRAHTVIAVVTDDSEEVPFTIGTASALDIAAAAKSAIGEAVYHRRTLRRTWDVLPVDVDPAEIDGIRTRSSYWTLSRNLNDLREVLRLVSGDRRELDSTGYATGDVSSFWSSLHATAGDVYCVRVATPETDRLGVIVAKVVAPDLQPMYLDEQFAAVVPLLRDAGATMPSIPHPFL